MVNELNFGGRVVVNESGPSRANEVVSRDNCPLPCTDPFKVYRKERNDKGVARGPREVKPVVKAKSKATKSTVKRGPGRPRVYDGTDRRIVAAALKKYGITKGRVFLRKERKLKVSVTLCRQVAEEVGITFKRGRPAA